MGSRVRVTLQRQVRGGAGPAEDIRGDVNDQLLENAGAVVPLVFYFLRPLDEEALVAGLEVALQRYPLFAGRLRRDPDGLTLVCNDAGGRFSSAEVDATLAEAVAAPASRGGDWLFDSVSAGAARAGTGALLTARITRYRDGSAALACCWHHALGDMTTFMGLMRAWSAAVEGQPQSPPIIARDRPGHFASCIPDDCPAPPGVRLVGWGELARLGALVVGGRRRTVQVYFGAGEIARMREALSRSAGLHLTFNDVICAHLWTVLRRADGDASARTIAIAVDVRRRLGLDRALVGNLARGIRLPFAPGAPPERVAASIRAAVDGYGREHSDYHATTRFVEGLPRGQRKRCLPLEVDPLKKTLLVTSWSNSGVYDVSFGGQRPEYFSPVSRAPVPWISALVEGPRKSGIVWTAMLPSRLADALEHPGFAAQMHPLRGDGDEVPEMLRGAVR